MYTVRETQVEYMPMHKGMLYEPEGRNPSSRIAVVVFYLHLYNVRELARRGYPVLFIPSEDHGNADERQLCISRAVEYMHRYPGAEKVIAMSWSGGCAALTAYQAVAENGVRIFQGENMLIPCTDFGKLTPADGIILLDSNWGAAMTLLSLEPAVLDETSGMKLSGGYDYYDPSSGYREKDCRYDPEFFRKYIHAQALRMNRLIDFARERIQIIDKGMGRYEDDEPLIIPGGNQIKPCNKLINQDMHLFSHTARSHKLLHNGGSITNEIIYSVRQPEKAPDPVKNFHAGAKVTTVKNFLRQDAVRAMSSFTYGEDDMTGLEVENTYTSTPCNVRYISVPLLAMGMTAGYEFLVAEKIYDNAIRSRDKDLAFVEGADHIFQVPAGLKDRGYGDVTKTLYDYVSAWLGDAERF